MVTIELHEEDTNEIVKEELNILKSIMNDELTGKHCIGIGAFDTDPDSDKVKIKKMVKALEMVLSMYTVGAPDPFEDTEDFDTQYDAAIHESNIAQVNQMWRTYFNEEMREKNAQLAESARRIQELEDAINKG